jgi:hypothetical protein
MREAAHHFIGRRGIGGVCGGGADLHGDVQTCLCLKVFTRVCSDLHVYLRVGLLAVRVWMCMVARKTAHVELTADHKLTCMS